MNLVEEKKRLLREEFEYFNDAQERFEYIISKSKSMESLSEELKREEFLVKGCVSNLWLIPTKSGDKFLFRADADSLITRGIASLVCEMYSGLTSEEIRGFDCKFLEELKISQYLSPNRRNGLSKLCDKIQFYGSIL